jgi:hypothetical protein
MTVPGRRWVLGALVGSVFAFALAACSSGSTGPPPSTTAHPGVAVLGDTTAVWQSAHPSVTVGGAAGYGSSVTVDGQSVPQFTALQESGGRVVGFHMSIPPATRLATAEQLVRAQLPTDVEQTASWRGTFKSTGGFCEFVNYKSAKLAAQLPPATASASNVGIKVFEVKHGKAGSPSIRTVNSADVSTTPGVVDQAC